MRVKNLPSTRPLPQLESLEDRIVLDASTYVGSLYTNVLHRTGSPAEVAGWVNYINQGHTSGEVAKGFTKSSESLANEVKTEYMSILGRPVDGVGLNDGTALLAKPAAPSDLSSKLLNSAEYKASHQTDASFVTGLYKDVLNRTPDPAGDAGWLAVITNPSNRSVAVSGFLKSSEHIGQTVTTLYEDTLQRVPSTQESSADESELSNDQEKYDNLAVTLLTSPEYEAKYSYSG